MQYCFVGSVHGSPYLPISSYRSETVSPASPRVSGARQRTWRFCGWRWRSTKRRWTSWAHWLRKWCKVGRSWWGAESTGDVSSKNMGIMYRCSSMKFNVDILYVQCIQWDFHAIFMGYEAPNTMIRGFWCDLTFNNGGLMGIVPSSFQKIHKTPPLYGFKRCHFIPYDTMVSGDVQCEGQGITLFRYLKRWSPTSYFNLFHVQQGTRVRELWSIHADSGSRTFGNRWWTKAPGTTSRHVHSP